MKLLLFDIDGTILLTDGAGTRAANRAFEKVHGLGDAMKGIDAAGKTDPLIMREMFANGLARDYTQEEAEELYREYVIFLEEEVENCRIEVMPGIPYLLESLSSRTDVMLGIATGNIEHGARIKLRKSGLDSHFSVGGFGSDSGSREALIRVAIERARGSFTGFGGFRESIRDRRHAPRHRSRACGGGGNGSGSHGEIFVNGAYGAPSGLPLRALGGL